MAGTPLSSGRKRSPQRRTLAFREMTTYERTSYLKPLIGKKIRFVLVSDLQQHLAVFGPECPIPYQRAQIRRFIPYEGKHAMMAIIEDDSPFTALNPEEVLLTWDELDDVLADEVLPTFSHNYLRISAPSQRALMAPEEER
jgi:hypothetical protein